MYISVCYKKILYGERQDYLAEPVRLAYSLFPSIYTLVSLLLPVPEVRFSSLENPNKKKFAWLIKNFSSLPSDKLYSAPVLISGFYW